MAGLLRKRKGKAAASTSEAPRFKTLYHESHFNKFFAAREVLPELRIKIDDDVFSSITAQINLRKWQRLTKLFLMVGDSLVREFYANAWRLEEQKNQPLTYTTQIRGTEINFSPKSIHSVLKLRDTPLPNAASYHDKNANNNLRLDEVLACLCVEGAQWVRHLDGRPHFLRRTDLQPMAMDWYEFVCRLIMPTINCSEVNVERAVLIHAIIIGEDIHVDEIIAEQMYKFVNKTNTRSKLPFPSQHYDQRWDALQQKFDDAQEENRRSFGAINQRMNQMDDRLSFLCYSHQLANESMLFPYQNTTRQMREMEQQDIPIIMANLNIHRAREKEMRQERMRYEKILEEAAAQKAKEQNKGKARRVEEDYDNEETEDKGGEW
ncbi:hypothetical protein PIB30_095394 [Stylosanthes scabra]|uniref:Putative plant transposon protein domain-containing protein n=1 Tax=Stylosanthes scabra TaxID=79078 RepID=A0ABU6VW17_9FABA|nr:hypothetical protein [Stylosanthes scabra]